MYTDPARLLNNFLLSNVYKFSKESNNSSLKHFEDIFQKKTKNSLNDQTECNGKNYICYQGEIYFKMSFADRLEN